MIMLVSLEIYVAILAVSMPVFWPILQQSFGGIVVRHEVQVTSRHVSAFEELEDGDTKSEHGSETALGPERNQKGKRGFYTEDLEMEQFGGPGKNNVRIGARRGSQGSLVDSTTYERLR